MKMNGNFVQNTKTIFQNNTRHLRLYQPAEHDNVRIFALEFILSLEFHMFRYMRHGQALIV